MNDGTGESEPAQRAEMAAKLGRLAGLQARAAARRAQSYVADHDAELRTAGLAAAQFAVNRVTHPVLRPLLHAAAAEFAKGARQPAPNDAAGAGESASGDDGVPHGDPSPAERADPAAE